MSFPGKQLGWKATLNLAFKHTPQKTVLANRSQSGPLTVQRPFYPEGDICHIYLLHPPGGVVGGDELHINVILEDAARVLMTTPGATKFYRSNGALARQEQVLTIADNCSLEWFPQENIFFNETQSQLSTRINLSGSARFMGWEINCYGRPASDLLFNEGRVTTSLEIYRDGNPVLLDKLLIADNRALQSRVSMDQFPCFGTLVATHATQELLEKARNISQTIGKEQQLGITLLDDILIVRCLGEYAEQISTTLKLIWSALRQDVLGRKACHPRIWST